MSSSLTHHLAHPRIHATSGAGPNLKELIDRLLNVSIRGLPAMFESATKTFIHSARSGDRKGGAVVNVGQSPRYTAITLLGVQYLAEPQQKAILDGMLAADVCRHHLARLDEIENIGDVALFAWLAAELGLAELGEVLDRVILSLRDAGPVPTIEFAWCLMALASGRHEEAHPLARRLLDAGNLETGVFPHMVGERGGLRGHVGSFADQVYPIQALATYAKAFQSEEAMQAANRCARMICDLQGPQGQWWWHYDARSGQVVEGYPVYSVHQDAMGPMALFDLEECGGDNHVKEIVTGLRWMEEAAEIGRSLIEDERGLIWRKVARREPAKLSRKIRAVSSRIHRSLRLRWLNGILPPVAVDYECRPYHLGWVLYAWLKYRK